MNELFGVSMNLIMYVLLGIMAVALASVAYVALTNRIMFKMGIRNIPRRRAQTTLIVLGLMLSTVIIAAAFTTGDTVDRSITSEVYNVLGSLDEVLQLRPEDDDTFEDPSLALTREATFPADAVAPVISTLKSNSAIDYVIPGFSSLAVALNPDKRLSSPEFNVMGLDPAQTSGLPDIERLSGGERLTLDQLARNELYLNKSAAEELNLKEGDSVRVVTGEKTVDYKVKAIVRDRRLAGAGGISVRREGAIMTLAMAQELFNAPGQLTMIAVSNRGDARGGYAYTDEAETAIRAALASAKATNPAVPDLAINPIKETGVDIATLGANFLTTFFLVFGLFSIGAGIMLIFLIFVMLAAERKSEMGMARAVGTKRMDLVQTFLAEGMAYNLMAAAVGCALGVLVAFVMARVMQSLFAEIDISISPYVTPRSLLISYSVGVVLTFLTVTFSSWRVSNLNIVRAIRDIPEPPSPRPMWRARGFFSTLWGLVFKPGWIISKKHLGPLPVWVPNYRRLVLLVLGIILISASGAASGFVQVLMAMGGGLSLLLFVFFSFQFGFLFVIASVPLILQGMSANSSFMLLFGLSLLPLGLAMIARSFGANDRLSYTLVGLFLIYIWEIDFTFDLVTKIFGENSGDFEMFFLSGVMVTIAATFVVVYNSEIILGPLTSLGSRLGKLLPSLKMAVAYPLASKLRTGMTMAMFCLVVFALTVMSSMNYNFNRLYLSDQALGGWDIQVDEHPTNPIGDLRSSLAATGSPVVNDIEAVGTTEIATRFRTAVCQDGFGHNCDAATINATKSDWEGYTIWGDDDTFFATSDIRLQARAAGYGSDEAVWKAAASDPTLVIVDVAALSSDFGFGIVRGIKPDDKAFEPPVLTLADRITGKTARVKVIGVIDEGASQTYMALHIHQRGFDALFGQPEARMFFVKTRDGANNVTAARQIEASLLETGAQAESLRQRLNDLTSVQSGFFYLLQGFMGLGLVVGVAAVGVIAFRTVVERRQQIGMLRALGYTKQMIGLTFLMESAYIAFAGVVSGIIFALILAYQLITEEFANQGASFSVPWLQVGIIASLAFGSALLMTVIPARQASSIPIAEALRYE